MAKQRCDGEAGSPGASLRAERSCSSPLQRAGRGTARNAAASMEGAELRTDLPTGQAHFLVGTVPGSELGASAQAELRVENSKPPGLGCIATGERDGDDGGWRAAEELRGCRRTQPPSVSAPKCRRCPARCRQRRSPSGSVPPT